MICSPVINHIRRGTHARFCSDAIVPNPTSIQYSTDDKSTGTRLRTLCSYLSIYLSLSIYIYIYTCIHMYITRGEPRTWAAPRPPRATSGGPDLPHQGNDLSISLSLSIYIYIYIHTYTYTYIHICIHVSMYVSSIYLALSGQASVPRGGSQSHFRQPLAYCNGKRRRFPSRISCNNALIRGAHEMVASVSSSR